MIGEIGVNGDIKYVYVFTGVAIFILLIACFNFTNLSTARSLTRAKEVGLRKVVGAREAADETIFKRNSILCIDCSCHCSYYCLFVLPVFNQFSDRQLSFDFNHNLFTCYHVVFTCIVCRFAGRHYILLLFFLRSNPLKY